MKPLALAILWAAVVHRIYLLRRYGLASWRVYLLIAVAALALATTFHFYRTDLDVLLGVPSLAGLVDRVVLTISWVAVQLYVLDLRRLDGRTHQRGRETRLLIAAVVIVAMVISWFAIPVHHTDVTDLTPYAREPAVLVYTAGFYVYVVWLLVDLGSFAGSRMRAIRRSDPFGAVAGALIAFACALGVVVMGLYVAYVAMAFVGHRYSSLDRWGTLLFPVPMALLALGLLLIPMGPRLARWTRARRELREIEDLWAYLVSARPSVHLNRGDGLSRSLAAPGAVLQRRLIETADALADVDVPIAVPAAPEALADALCRPLPRGEGRPAADVLKALSQDHQEAEVLVALGRAFHRAQTPRT